MGRKRWRIWLLTLGLLAVCANPVSAKENKKLYFEEKKGIMTWDPGKGTNGNWFMDFDNMVPGGNYEENLKIENGSNKTYKLYVQAIPLEQGEKEDQLLEQISMNVTLGSDLIYSGTASGKEYDHGNLQNVIYLGTYQPGKEAQITVQLELNKDLGIEYSDRWTKNDWKFMVTEVKQSGRTPMENSAPQALQPPKTGDSTNLIFYQTVLSASFLFIVVLSIRDKKKRTAER